MARLKLRGDPMRSMFPRGGHHTMLFMVIEHFNQAAATEVYRRVRDKGRALPDGLTYVDSWVEASLQRCFQLIETDDPALLQQWVLHWSDLGTFEIVPVVPSARTREVVLAHLDALPSPAR
jgi:hypothetical protein